MFAGEARSRSEHPFDAGGDGVARATHFGEADQFTGQEFERSARPPGGWLGTACSLPNSFRFAPDRGSSLSAQADRYGVADVRANLPRSLRLHHRRRVQPKGYYAISGGS